MWKREGIGSEEVTMLAATPVAKVFLFDNECSV
jgi:hypothetical protein